MGVERRSAPRYRFVAEAEVTQILTDTKLRARTSDLSIGGCFLDMLNPCPKGTEITVRILHAGTSFTARGRVAFLVPNIGMGIAFTNVDGDQISVLRQWLLDVSRVASKG
jgi:PilZ domain